MTWLKRSTGDPNWEAFQFTGFTTQFPPWFDRMIFNSKARLPDGERPMSVKIITGAWQVVENGDWVVLHNSYDLWTMTDEDFHKAYREL
jgi:hypothetical protein